MANHKHSVTTYETYRDAGWAGGSPKFWLEMTTGETGEIAGAEGASTTHTHNISVTSAKSNFIPPYYALSYIVRIM